MRLFLLGNPLFRILLAFVLGILLFEYLPQVDMGIWFFSSSVLLFVAHLIVSRYSKMIYKLRWLFGCGVFLFFSALSFHLSARFSEQTQFEQIDEAAFFKAEITQAAVEKPNSYQLKINILSSAADSLHYKSREGRAVLYLQKTASAKSLQIGDEILLSTKFTQPSSAKNPEAFDYALYLQRKGFSVSAYADSLHWQRLKNGESFSVFQMAASCRQKLLGVYRNYGISGDEFSVLAALTLGYKDELSDDLYQTYSDSGALHILSVSGLHVGIIYLILLYAISFLKYTTRMRLIRSVLIVLLLWVYAFLAGLSPSVMRACLMFTIISGGTIFSYKSSIYNAIFASAIVLLCFNPNYLFDVSFLLSYSAVLSIVYFQPRFKKLFYFKNKILNWSWDLFCVSVAAQIGTFPIGLYFFHKFSNHFLLTNFLAIPIATLIIYVAVLLFVFSSFTLVATWVSFVLQLLLKAQNASIRMVESLPFSTSHLWISKWELFLLYALVLTMTLFVLKKRYAYLFSSLLLLLGLAIFHLHRTIAVQDATELLVYADRKATAIEFVEKGKHQVFSTEHERTKRIASSFWLKYQRDDKMNELSRNRFFSFNNQKIAVLVDSDIQGFESKSKMQLDYLVIGNSAACDLDAICKVFDFGTLVLDNTVSQWKMLKMKRDCELMGVNFYSTEENGVFRLQIAPKVH